MEWEFTAEDVVKGRAAYGLEEFRRDLAQEVQSNMLGGDEAQHTRSFNLLYDLCHVLATDKSFDDFISAYAYDPPTCEFLANLKPHMSENATMLGAILQRQIMDRIEARTPLADAVQEVAAWHAQIVAGRLASCTA